MKFRTLATAALALAPMAEVQAQEPLQTHVERALQEGQRHTNFVRVPCHQHRLP